MAVNAIARVGTNLIDETTLMSNDGGVGQGRPNDAEGGRSVNRVNGQRWEMSTASGEGHGKCQDSTAMGVMEGGGRVGTNRVDKSRQRRCKGFWHWRSLGAWRMSWGGGLAATR
jgi:hypothetical protein